MRHVRSCPARRLEPGLRDFLVPLVSRTDAFGVTVVFIPVSLLLSPTLYCSLHRFNQQPRDIASHSSQIATEPLQNENVQPSPLHRPRW